MGVSSLYGKVHAMSAQLDCDWATIDVDIHYLVHAEAFDQPLQFEIVGVFLGKNDISHYMNSDYIFDLIADDFGNADLHIADFGEG